MKPLPTELWTMATGEIGDRDRSILFLVRVRLQTSTKSCSLSPFLVIESTHQNAKAVDLKGIKGSR